MFEMFERYLQQHITGLTREDIQLICSKTIVKKLRKRQMILHEGEICRFKIFVVKGLLRNYSVNSDGNEYILKFTAECGWTTDPDSYNNLVASKYNIDAIEPSEIIMWTRENFDALKYSIPALNTFSESVVNKNTSLNLNRILLSISATAEEKYLDFIQTFPDIFHRVPLHMVASYLGVSRETLTRIRQGLAVAAK